jgi:hypothetical protein
MSTGTFGVETSGLLAAGGRIGQVTGELVSAQAGLREVDAAGAAAQHPAVAAGASQFVAAWGRGLMQLQNEFDGLGSALMGSGCSYEMTDQNNASAFGGSSK